MTTDDTDALVAAVTGAFLLLALPLFLVILAMSVLVTLPFVLPGYLIEVWRERQRSRDL